MQMVSEADRLAARVFRDVETQNEDRKDQHEGRKAALRSARQPQRVLRYERFGARDLSARGELRRRDRRLHRP